VAKKCEQVEAQKIADFRAKNQSGGNPSQTSQDTTKAAMDSSKPPLSTSNSTKAVSATDNISNSTYCDEECTTNIALQDHNAAACNSLKDSNPCIISYVKKFNEPEKCNQATNSLTCFNYISEAIGPVVCKSAKDNDGLLECVGHYFKYVSFQSSNPKYQECLHKESDITMEIACTFATLPLQGVTSNDLLNWKAKDSSLIACSSLIPESIGTQKNDYCIASIGVYAKSLSICDQAEGSPRAECYGMLADTDNSITLSTCDKLDTGVSFCYMHVAYRLNDPSICDKAGDNKDNCLRLVASRNTA
jgi:hypothetical protein